MRVVLFCLTVLGGTLLPTGFQRAGQQPVEAGGTLTATLSQKEFLSLEPILITVDLGKGQAGFLPAVVGKDKEKVSLRFDVQPPVKARSGARPLPLEAQTDQSAMRLYDLLEWYEFPAAGTFAVRAVLRTGADTVSSTPVTLTVRQPGPQDGERGPVDRLHHLPWSNYVTQAFCGDTFDLVKQWPRSKLARYAHYWNGLHHQHKKEYDKAIASFRILLADFPDFALAPDAELGILECLLAQQRLQEAAKHPLDARVKGGRSAITERYRLLRFQLNSALFREQINKLMLSD